MQKSDNERSIYEIAAKPDTIITQSLQNFKVKLQERIALEGNHLVDVIFKKAMKITKNIVIIFHSYD